MSEDKKAVLFTGGVVLVVALAGSGYWLVKHHSSPQAVNYGATSMEADNSLSLSDDSLSVNGSSGADDLGQLGTSSQSGVAGGQGGSSAGSSSSPVDPSTFAQYNKYANNSTALFGDVQVGSGTTLGANQKATITYKGWLTDGTLFDQSQTNSNGQLVPLAFTMGANQVIPGLEEGIDGMKVGGMRLVIVPPALGYGAQGQGAVPANAVLVFEVNLLDVN